MAIEGGCYCGALRYRIEGEPVLKAMCFCRECQHVAGGGPAVLMAVPEAAHHYTKGTPAVFRRPDLAEPVAREFCSACGTHILSRSPRGPGMALVKVGSLDDPSLFGLPQAAIMMAEAHAWHAVPEGVPCFEARPPVPAQA